MGSNIRYTIYEPPGIIIVKKHGRITLRDLSEHVDELTRDSRFRNDFDKLVDMTDVESFEMDFEDAKQLVNHKLAMGVRERRIAFVAKDDFSYGIGRMYQIVSEDLHEDISVFRSMDEALAWLNLGTEFKIQLIENPNTAHQPTRL